MAGLVRSGRLWQDNYRFRNGANGTVTFTLVDERGCSRCVGERRFARIRLMRRLPTPVLMFWLRKQMHWKAFATDVTVLVQPLPTN